jgi:tetratricopeptide (TPR) repeat protein
MGRETLSKKQKPLDRRAPGCGAMTAASQGTGPVASNTHTFVKQLLLAAALIAFVFLTYQPAWRGGFIWDDDAHVTPPNLRSYQGLSRIWFDVRATLQYYPLLHSAFWLEHRLWGDSTLGYHLVNISLHCTVALLFVMVLKRLAVPGAWLAGFIFALHPVHVESVAWITELKNTLSGVFYLGAALLYLRFDQTRKWGWYLAAAVVFAMALASKSVTGTLPAALLVVFWWKRGTLSWTRDVAPISPLFLMGAAAGMLTAWWELEMNRCVGPEFEFSWAERILIAGRAAWFQLRSLLWPAHLTFFYPRWQINPRDWQQYLYPLGVAALLVSLWAIRSWSRAPLAAFLFFGGTLVPVLGFLNLLTMLYTFVTDHYQYLASLGIIALVSSGAALLTQRAHGWARVCANPAGVAVVALLAVLSWQQCHMYMDIETLYRTSIDRNPECWMAHINLGTALAQRGQADDAIYHYRRALAIKPDSSEAHTDLGMLLANRQEVEEALSHCKQAIEIDDNSVVAHNNYGMLLANLGKTNQAIEQYRRAIEIKPDYPDAHNNLGAALAESRQKNETDEHYRARMDEAIDHYQKALDLNPDFADAHNNLGVALASLGRIDDAIAHYRRAAAIKPDSAELNVNLGAALADRGLLDEAFERFQKALSLAVARNDTGLADFIRAEIKRRQANAPTNKTP